MQFVVQFRGPVLVPGSIQVTSSNAIKFKLDWGNGPVEHKLISLGNKKWIWFDAEAPRPNREIDGLNFLSWDYELGKKNLSSDSEGRVPSFGHVIQTIAERDANKHPDITFFSDVLIDGGFAA